MKTRTRTIIALLPGVAAALLATVIVLRSERHYKGHEPLVDRVGHVRSATAAPSMEDIRTFRTLYEKRNEPSMARGYQEKADELVALAHSSTDAAFLDELAGAFRDIATSTATPPLEKGILTGYLAQVEGIRSRREPISPSPDPRDVAPFDAGTMTHIEAAQNALQRKDLTNAYRSALRAFSEARDISDTSLRNSELRKVLDVLTRLPSQTGNVTRYIETIHSLLGADAGVAPDAGLEVPDGGPADSGIPPVALRRPQASKPIKPPPKVRPKPDEKTLRAVRAPKSEADFQAFVRDSIRAVVTRYVKDGSLANAKLLDVDVFVGSGGAVDRIAVAITPPSRDFTDLERKIKASISSSLRNAVSQRDSYSLRFPIRLVSDDS